MDDDEFHIGMEGVEDGVVTGDGVGFRAGELDGRAVQIVDGEVIALRFGGG